MPAMMPGPQNAQAYGELPPEEQAEQAFKEQFSQTAYTVLASKFPNYVQNVVTFKLLDTDVPSGRGVGVFILMLEDRPLYIPVIMSDGRIKPMDMFYCKEMNVFLPLTPEWVGEATKMSLENMGEGSKVPDEVPRDVDLKNVTTPPFTASSGRFGYASAGGADPAVALFKIAQEHVDLPKDNFLQLLKKGHQAVLDGVKLAFDRNPELLKKFVNNYGVSKIKEAFSEGYGAIKVAAVREPEKLHIVGSSASPEDLKNIFGKEAGRAYSQIVKEGYAFIDTRNGINKVAMKVEAPTWFSEPGGEPSWYRLYFVDGHDDIYYVIPFPKDPNSSGFKQPVYTYDGSQTHRVPMEYLVISSDGKEAWVDYDVTGVRVTDLDEVKNTPLYKVMNNEIRDAAPRPGQKGFFLVPGERGPQVTRILEVNKVTDNGGVLNIDTYQGRYIKDDSPTRRYITATGDNKYVFVPGNSKWVSVERADVNKRDSLLKDPQFVAAWLDRRLQDAGGEVLEVKKASDTSWWVPGEPSSVGFHRAVTKIASEYALPVNTAINIVKEARMNGKSRTLLMSPAKLAGFKAQFTKEAQPPAPQQDPAMAQQQQQMPPMDPAMMQQMAPPQPNMSPADVAIAEAIQNLQHQNELQTQQNMAQMQQMQQQLMSQEETNQQLIGVLQNIQQRSQEISGAAGGVMPPGTEEAPAAVAGMMAPPPAPEEAPPPVMATEPTSPEEVAGQINPMMVDGAAQLQDQGVFDAAAISMLASSPALQDIVATYLPNLEKAVDNIGRVLLTMWLQEEEIKASLGDEQFIHLEDGLRKVFKDLGEVVIDVSQNANPDVSREVEQETMMQNATA